jgi:hypothetical protein
MDLVNLDVDYANATGRIMIDDGLTLTDPKRLDVVLDFSMPDRSHGVLKFNTKSIGYASEATKLNKIQILAADTTYAYSLTKARINGKTQVDGKYDRSKKILEYDFGGIQMDTIEHIDFAIK